MAASNYRNDHDPCTLSDLMIITQADGRLSALPPFVRICSAKLYIVGAVLRVKVSNDLYPCRGTTFIAELTILEGFLDRG